MKLEMSPDPKGKACSQSKDQTTSSTGNMLCLWFLKEWEDSGKGHFFQFLAQIAEFSKILAADFHAAK